MNNHVYIIASLPVLERESNAISESDLDDSLRLIEEQCSNKEKEEIAILLEKRYFQAPKSRENFLREYLRFDLALCNCKVQYLNEKLGRPRGTDEMRIEGFDVTDEEKAEMASVYNKTDLLERERELDNLRWRKTESMTELETLNFNIILGFLVKMGIVRRWLRLDPETGRNYFRQLVGEVRGSFKGFNDDIKNYR